jgi:hypothetical protein
MKRALALLILFGAVALAQTPTHQVTVSWTDTVNPTGTDYNVYRLTGTCPSGTPTGFTLLNATPLSVMTYADTAVTGGTTYCYYVTAVNSSGSSAPSSTVQAAVPSLFQPGTPTATAK